jgi:excisionase family DNA binding protein
MGVTPDGSARVTGTELTGALEGGVRTKAEGAGGSVPAADVANAVTRAVTGRAYAEADADPRSAPLLTVHEAAARVGCSEDTIRRAYTCRELKVVRFGAGRVRVMAAAIDSWLADGGRTKPAASDRRNDGCVQTVSEKGLSR